MAKTTVAFSCPLTSAALLDACADVILSRPAMNAAGTTLAFYRFTVGKFLEWAENTHAYEKDVRDPASSGWHGCFAPANNNAWA